MPSSPTLLRHFPCGEVIALYWHDTDTCRVGLWLVPAAREGAMVPRREFLHGVEIDSYAMANAKRFPAWQLDSLAQAHERGDGYPPAFAQGRTLRGGPTVEKLKFTDQTVSEDEHRIAIRTSFTHEDRGWHLHHNLVWRRDASWLESSTTVENAGAQPITLEMLASFSLGGITPFASDAAPGRLRLHRFRSVWSMEGRLETRALEDLQLEPSWGGWGVRCERFGAVGSLPVSGFFPFAAIEDTDTGVVWGARLAHPGSWQMEVYRRDDTVSLSGGIADREFGHWWKTLAPGQSLSSPVAQITCVSGTLDDACAALTAADEPMSVNQSAIERELPVVFNEWMTTWGRPSQDNLVALAACLRGTGVKYLVIDAGWFAPERGSWTSAHGDWLASPALFPKGLRATADAIRAAGLVPGLWFEMETCGPASSLWTRPELLLHRDGQPLTVNGRRFLDFRTPEVAAYLSERVIGTLRAGGFGYVKIDYNDNIGLGVDGAESPGEGLRGHLAGVQVFFRRIARELPDVVIENCSSGGHRLEPSMLALSDMSSFSDAHECPELPIIAANLHRLMLPRQAQIWAALRTGESAQRTGYSLAAGFLGRLCLSGDFLSLDATQREFIRHALGLYRRAAPIIRSGRSTRFGNDVLAYRRAEGWQAIVRQGTETDGLLVVAHTFGRPPSPPISIPLPSGAWRIADALCGENDCAALRDGMIVWRHPGEWAGIVVVLEPALPSSR